MYVCIKRQNGKDQGYNIVERKVLGKKIETERLEIHPFYLHQWDGGVLGSFSTSTCLYFLKETSWEMHI